MADDCVFNEGLAEGTVMEVLIYLAIGFMLVVLAWVIPDLFSGIRTEKPTRRGK